ncbi:hypothetical protein BAE44_0018509 [Dichanthelium oligosanthes]|uniref:F-box domain-containing protein n=1 Tax=Dichanthelium oligosanthes TaxID=888268 RepID=A0A1E5V5N9_9POAL|nr:hypothetical protein BAE44_0018509 [Dichanthelium oligosanthes]
MISKLNDDVLLSVLGNVNLTTSVRASVLSTRWRRLPWLLTQHSIDIKDFLREPYADPTVDDHIDKSMSSLKEAVRSMLAPTYRKYIITRLCIWFFVTSRQSFILNIVGQLHTKHFLPVFIGPSLQIWLQPEKDQLRSAFSSLRELRLHDIFVGFGLMWTTALLEAASALEILKVF